MKEFFRYYFIKCSKRGYKIINQN